MKRFLPIIAVAITAAIFMLNNDTAQAQSAAAAPYRHVVIFKFKNDAPKDKVDGIVKAFGELKTKLPAIQSFEWGTNVSPEGHDQGFTHCFTLTFKDKESLEKHYLHEPAHKEFGAMLGPVLDKVMVFDYVAQ